MRVAEKVGRRLRRATDTGKLGYPMRLDLKLETGLDDCCGDRVVTASRAKGRNGTLVISACIAERVLGQRRVVEFGLRDIGHDTTLRRGVTLKASRCARIARAMNRAVIGVPS